MASIEVHPLRLNLREGLKNTIQQYVNEKNMSAGWIASCAGSLTRYQIRFANQSDGAIDSGHFEIVSLTGTVSDSDSQIHIALSDSLGKIIGGHLLEGCIIYTTAEIIIQRSEDYIFTRKKDGTTDWPELQITARKGSFEGEN